MFSIDLDIYPFKLDLLSVFILELTRLDNMTIYINFYRG